MRRPPSAATPPLDGTRRHRALLAGVAACALLGLLAAASCPLAADEPADRSAEVDALFACVTDAEAPGASVIVVKAGEVLHAKGYGLANVELGVPNRTDTVLRLGSITKMFTAAAVLQLHDRGLLDIDDRVAKHLPDAPHADEITIRQLLTHTSGITSLEKDAPLEFAPGERMNYSNNGYHVLGKIIEKISGDSYEEYLRKSIFGPLGMKSSGYDHQASIIENRASGYAIGPSGDYLNAGPADLSAAYAAGALYSTLDDMRLWDQALSSGKLLRPETLAQAFSPVTLNDGREANYGFGWMIGSYRGLKEIGHGGDITGFNSWISRFPDRDFTVVVLSNIEMRPPGPLPTARDLAHRIAEIYLGESMEAEEERAPVVLDPELLSAYAGQYKISGSPELAAAMGDTLAVTTDGSSLFAETKMGKVQLIPESETEFSCIPDTGARLIFVPDETGRATKLIINIMDLREVYAERVDAEQP